MSSASSWMKRLGVGGQLAPFFKSVCVYFLAQCVGSDGAPSLRAAAFKCAPVLCLLAAVAYRCTTLPQDKRRYCVLVCVGLSLSCAGDALLVWEGGLAGGMAAFGAAHVAYMAAFGRRGGWGGRAGAALAGGAALYLRLLAPRGVFRALVPAYAALVAGTAWRGAAAGGAAAAGALLFLVSDAALGYHLFAAPLPAPRLLVMPAYYMGQLGIAYSALTHQPDTHHAPVSVQ